MADTKHFVRGGEGAKLLNVSQQTLRKYADSGEIESIRTPGGQRMYNIREYMIRKGMTPPPMKSPIEEKDHQVCYCRVSTNGQKDDLASQIAYMKAKYKDYEIITDIGSGINFNRKGLLQIIDYAINGTLKKLVVSYKDRLCRIGYSLLEYIFATYSDTEITIDGANEKEDVNEEIAKDVLEIITVYSAKIHGMRRYKDNTN
jgi:putative resolvase